MQFNHDNMTGVYLAADIVNLRARTDWSLDALEAVLRHHDIRRPELSPAAVTALRRWAVRLRAVFAAPDAETRCHAINGLLVDGAAGVYLTTHNGLRPHLHFTPDEDDVVGRIMSVTSGSLAIFTVEAEGNRLGACGRSGCLRVFVDTSRNGRRAYCSTRCSNADAVDRHRRRARHRTRHPAPAE
ncbi:CGNR zinc finger domain-containing protein [Nocardia sp. NPDC004604]|uniref:CGNR zinc finger domain-containing protein n=1 Tax=Nocardia sp. NPDC004604 TaxID=3157013 RepID=UPI0033A5375F